MKLLALWAFKKYISLGGRLADHSDFVWAFHFQSQGKARKNALGTRLDNDDDDDDDDCEDLLMTGADLS